MDQDDVRFSSFTRDLARRHRRPRSYPAVPATADALEQLCGGGTVIPPCAETEPESSPDTVRDGFEQRCGEDLRPS